MYIYIYLYIYISLSLYIYIHIYIHTQIYVYIYTYTHIHVLESSLEWRLIPLKPSVVAFPHFFQGHFARNNHMYHGNTMVSCIFCLWGMKVSGTPSHLSSPVRPAPGATVAPCAAAAQLSDWVGKLSHGAEVEVPKKRENMSAFYPLVNCPITMENH